MPPVTRVMVFKRLVWVAMRSGFLAASLLALVPPSAPAEPLAASFSFSPSAPLTGEPVTFASTSTGSPSSQRWDLDGDRVCDDAIGPTAQWSFWPAGLYAVMLCISDGTNEGTATQRFTVQNRPPAAAITFAPLSPMSGDSVTLASTSADPDGPLLSQDWDLDGDGAFDDSQGPTASVAFDAAGSHAVGLRVTDRDGAASVAAVSIPVRERPVNALSPFPVVRMAGSYSASGIRIQQLLVKAPIGARVEVDCRGRGCPFRKLIRKARSETIRIRRFARRILRKDAVVEIWVTQAGEIGKYTRFRIRKGKPPIRVDRCLMPGDERPARCP